MPIPAQRRAGSAQLIRPAHDAPRLDPEFAAAAADLAEGGAGLVDIADVLGVDTDTAAALLDQGQRDVEEGQGQ